MLSYLSKISYLNPVLLPIVSTFTQQIRTTFILKRKYKPNLTRKHERPLLRGKHYIYELIKDTNVIKRPNLDVILTTFVDGVGKKGEIVSLRPNFVYEKLLLPGLAVYKTQQNIEKYAVKDNEIIIDHRHSSKYAERTRYKLEHLILQLTMSMENPWTIEPWHIRTSLRKCGYYADENTIKLPETPITGPDLKKQNKEFMVTITINNLEEAKVKCRIHHWNTNPDKRLPYAVDHWKEPGSPLFITEDTI